MNDWVLIMATSALYFSLVGSLGLLLVVWRRQGMIRRLEARVEAGLGMSSPVASDRVMVLSTRSGVSPGGVPISWSAGNRTAIAVVVGVVVLIVGGGFAGWWFLGHSGGSSTSATDPAGIHRPSSKSLGSDPESVVPEDPPSISDRAAYTVAVLNASGVAGAAADRVAPSVATAGYRVGEVSDANDQTLALSVVMWTPGAQAVAQNVAKDLGITSAPPLDGVAMDSIGEADVVVVVGRDKASGP
ncbi:MAG: LytR family transcriptional regulator [Thermoleophilia bacterium]|nr:LytR family transcriptional regulator [Thermoleophilia bacterium]